MCVYLAATGTANCHSSSGKNLKRIDSLASSFPTGNSGIVLVTCTKCERSITLRMCLAEETKFLSITLHSEITLHWSFTLPANFHTCSKLNQGIVADSCPHKYHVVWNEGFVIFVTQHTFRVWSNHVIWAENWVAQWSFERSLKRKLQQWSRVY